MYACYCIYFLLGFLATVGMGTLFDTSNTSITFRNVDKSEMSNLLIALLFTAWMLESFLEILLKTFKLDVPKASSQTEDVSEEPSQTKDVSEESSQTKKEKSIDVARFTAIAGFIIGLIIAWSGVHTLGVFFSFDSVDNPNGGIVSESAIVSDSVDNSAIRLVFNSVDNPEDADNPDSKIVPDSKAKSIKEILFASVDAILTAGVIAGGSKGVHELTNAYKEFVQAAKERAT